MLTGSGNLSTFHKRAGNFVTDAILRLFTADDNMKAEFLELSQSAPQRQEVHPAEQLKAGRRMFESMAARSDAASKQGSLEWN